MTANLDFLLALEVFVKQTDDFVGALQKRLPDETDPSNILNPKQIGDANLAIAAILAEWRSLQAVNPMVMKFE
jgi:hypothetical protein